MFCYLRTSLLSERLAREIAQRIRLIYSDMPWDIKKRILSVASNFPAH
jgi:hypothetical protein